MRSWELGKRDLAALMECPVGESFVFRVKLRKTEHEYTLSVLCGHVNSGPDFHAICRTCELCSSDVLCCGSVKDRCALGNRLGKTESKFMSRVVTSRKAYRDGIAHRGNYATAETIGTDPILLTSILARLAYACGAGARCLQTFIDVLVVKKEELELVDAEGIRDRWLSKGARAGVKALVPHVTIKGPEAVCLSLLQYSGFAGTLWARWTWQRRDHQHRSCRRRPNPASKPFGRSQLRQVQCRRLFTGFSG